MIVTSVHNILLSGYGKRLSKRKKTKKKVEGHFQNILIESFKRRSGSEY